jgi:phage protein U
MIAWPAANAAGQCFEDVADADAAAANARPAAEFIGPDADAVELAGIHGGRSSMSRDMG